MKRLIIATMLVFAAGAAFAQESNCRDWYYIKDDAGHLIKDKCRTSWEQNDIGQPHGKYYLNKSNGAPWVIAFYRDGKLHGRYVEYYEYEQILSDSGKYYNGKRNGRWLADRFCQVTYKEGVITGEAVRRLPGNRLLKGRIGENGLYTGKILICENRLYPVDVPRRFDYRTSYPMLACEDCVKPFPKNLMYAIFLETDGESEMELIADVVDGELVSVEDMKMYLNGKPEPKGKELIAKALEKL